MLKPLLKWPGGKRWLAAKIVPHLEGTFKRYIEPFFGGGAVLFALEPPRGLASDTNGDLIDCYQAIRKEGHRVLCELNKLQCIKSEYYRIRDSWNPQCEFQRASRLIYLLRHSWNGLYRVNKKGRFNVPYCPRERKDRLTREMMTGVQSILQRVSLECQDFEQAIAKAEKGDLIFADPPYFENGNTKFGNYSSISFQEEDQERLAKALTTAERRGAAWILTDGCFEQVRTHFLGHDIFVVPRQSVIAADPKYRKRISEYVVLSRGSELGKLRQFLAENYKLVSN